MSDIINPYINHLLHDAQTITESFERVSNATGEHFNIFTILGIETREVGTHSRFIAELLNPMGSHKKGRIFLDLFLKKLNIEKEFNAGIPRVFVEKGFNRGANGENITGRIDIMIESNNGTSTILIENKIYAYEQENQLERYLQFRPEGHLFFLTLTGGISSKDNALKGKYHCISYSETILEWLELCRKESVTIPTLREIITSYLNLIKKLTYQNINSEMNNAIINRIKKDKNSMEAYFSLLNSAKALKILIHYEKLQDIINKTAILHNLEFNPYGDFPKSNAKYNGFTLVNDNLRKQNIKIFFEYQYTNNSGMVFGYRYIDPSKANQNDPKVTERFITFFSKTEAPNSGTQCYHFFDDYPNWAVNDTLIQIQFGDFEIKFKELVLQLIRIAA